MSGDAQGERLGSGLAAAAFKEEEGVQPIQQAAVHPLEGGGQPGTVRGARENDDRDDRPSYKTQHRQQSEQGRDQPFAGEAAEDHAAAQEQDQGAKADPQHESVLEEPEPFPAKLRLVQTGFNYREPRGHTRVSIR